MGSRTGLLAGLAVFASAGTAEADPSTLDGLSRDLVGALDEVCTNVELRDKALRDPQFLLEVGGVKLPDGFELVPFALEEYPVDPPGPTIELTHCRTYWVCESESEEPGPCRWTAQTVCLGLRVIDRREIFGPFPPR